MPSLSSCKFQLIPVRSTHIIKIHVSLLSGNPTMSSQTRTAFFARPLVFKFCESTKSTDGSYQLKFASLMKVRYRGGSSTTKSIKQPTYIQSKTNFQDLDLSLSNNEGSEGSVSMKIIQTKPCTQKIISKRCTGFMILKKVISNPPSQKKEEPNQNHQNYFLFRLQQDSKLKSLLNDINKKWKLKKKDLVETDRESNGSGKKYLKNQLTNKYA